MRSYTVVTELRVYLYLYVQYNPYILEPLRVILGINETAWRRCGETAAKEMRQMDIHTLHDMWRVQEGVGA